MDSKSKILFLDPFNGGSHRAFSQSYRDLSEYRVHFLGLPPRLWKWRSRASALYFAHRVAENPELMGVDAIVCSSMTMVDQLKAYWPSRTVPPVVQYAHETQLAYPSHHKQRPDVGLQWDDAVSLGAADRVVFNSASHRDRFLVPLERLIDSAPGDGWKPRWLPDRIYAKSTIVYPGALWPNSQPKLWSASPQDTRSVPRVLWNHRWEYDKKPADFFAMVRNALSREAKFRLVVLGENSMEKNPVFERAREEFSSIIDHWGYAESRDEYWRWLEGSQIVVSTAIQENFGISVVEAMGSGCIPLLPHRLSYPEILPQKFHGQLLYGTLAQGTDRLVFLLDQLNRPAGNWDQWAMELIDHGRSSFDRRTSMVQMDRILAQLI